MKRQLLLSLTLSLLAANAFALPATEQAAPQVKSEAATLSQPLKTLAADGADRVKGATFAADGSDRVKGATFAADGADRVKGAEFAADGSDRLKGNQVAEGGSDRLSEQRQQLS